MVGGALGVSEVFGTAVRFRVRLVTGFLALRVLLAWRDLRVTVDRFAVAFFARLTLVVLRVAMSLISPSLPSLSTKPERQGQSEWIAHSVM